MNPLKETAIGSTKATRIQIVGNLLRSLLPGDVILNCQHSPLIVFIRGRFDVNSVNSSLLGLGRQVLGRAYDKPLLLPGG